MNAKQARTVKIARGMLICAAAAFILAGILRGEVSVVLKKAVRICLECIGVA